MTGATFLFSLAAHLAYREGKDHGVNAQLAVLFCLRNRIAANWENGDLHKILNMEYITSDYPDIPDTRNPDFVQIIGAVEGIFDNSIQDRLTNNAFYWGNEMPLGATQHVAKVGSLLLWK